MEKVYRTWGYELIPSAPKIPILSNNGGYHLEYDENHIDHLPNDYFTTGGIEQYRTTGTSDMI